MACNTINIGYGLVFAYPVSFELEPDFNNVYPVSFEPETNTGNAIRFRFLIWLRLPKYPVPGRIIPIRLKPSWKVGGWFIR